MGRLVRPYLPTRLIRPTTRVSLRARWGDVMRPPLFWTNTGEILQGVSTLPTYLHGLLNQPQGLACVRARGMLCVHPCPGLTLVHYTLGVFSQMELNFELKITLIEA